MKALKYLIILTPLLLTVLLIGCKNNDDNPMISNQKALVTDPSDNAASVRLDKQVILSFAKPVDKLTVEKNFHLINDRIIMDSVCSSGKSMMHGKMSTVMMDSSKMNHFMDDHSIPGTFNWNPEYTQCIFTADSLLQSNTEYMMHFGEDMIKMMDERMGDMMVGGMMENGQGGMSGMGSGQMIGHMMWHFTTIDTTTGTGNGHLGHH